jgi:hypothetical protein
LDFSDKFFNVADVKGDVCNADIDASLFGRFGRDKSLHDALPELLGIIFVSGVDSIAVGRRREFGKQDSAKNGIVIIVKDGFAIEHTSVLHTAELKEEGDLGTPAREFLFGQNRNCLNSCLEDGWVNSIHCDKGVATGFVLFNWLSVGKQNLTINCEEFIIEQLLNKTRLRKGKEHDQNQEMRNKETRGKKEIYR